ncbi:MAG: crossover junction endodeoxyribonuclease RuvC [Holosporales bacterium]|jgi:crossover junction endodeoxyribonuclease RuvC
MRLLGLDPGLHRTGWGVVDAHAGRLSGVACGVVKTNPDEGLASRLVTLHRGLMAIMEHWNPDVAAVEETYVNTNARSALILGQARGVVLLAPALAGLKVHHYPAATVKKTVTGSGRAEKDQVAALVGMLLPTLAGARADAADALAVAICHAQHSAISHYQRSTG